jgi:hypothetical protein
MLRTSLNFTTALAGINAVWRWYQTTTIRPPIELSYGGPTTIETGPLVAFIKEIARLKRRAASWTAFAALLEGLATIAHYYGRLDEEKEHRTGLTQSFPTFTPESSAWSGLWKSEIMEALHGLR